MLESFGPLPYHAGGDNDGFAICVTPLKHSARLGLEAGVGSRGWRCVLLANPPCC